MGAVRLTQQKGIELLKKGHSLTEPGPNLNTLKMGKDGNIIWKGKNDQQATILNQNDTRSLFTKFWFIDLI